MKDKTVSLSGVKNKLQKTLRTVQARLGTNANQKLLAIGFVIVFAGVGTYFLIRSRAATISGWDVANVNPYTGPEYYKQWPNGPNPTGDPNYFPISVWLQDPCRIQSDGRTSAEHFRDRGVDILIGLNLNNSMTIPAGTYADRQACANKAGLKWIVGGYSGSTNEVQTIASSTSLSSSVKGFHIYDEPDMFGGPGNGCMDPAIVTNWANAVRATDSSRPVHINYGKGIGDPYYGGCPWPYVSYLPPTDILSADYYGNCDQYGYQGVWTYGRTVDRLFSMNAKVTTKQKPAWNFIDVIYACPTPYFAGRMATPSGAQMNSSVWMSIIHGATGIEYFCANFSGGYQEDGCLKGYTDATAQMNKTNELIRALAPVINTPHIKSAVTVTTDNPNVPIDYMVKQYNGGTYIFSISSVGDNQPADGIQDPPNPYGGTANATFTVNGISNATVEVIGEGRTVSMSSGKFTDYFGPNGKDLYGNDNNYQVHIYKIGGTAISTPPPTTTPPPTSTPPPSSTTPVTTPFRLNSGGSSYSDGTNTWSADQYYVTPELPGGGIYSVSTAIANTANDSLYQSERWGLSGYNVPITNGTYTVNLHFAEISSAQQKIGGRMFNVDIEGGRKLTNYDIFAKAGANAAIVESFTVSVTDGVLNLGFSKGSADEPKLSGFEILPTTTAPSSAYDLVVTDVSWTPSNPTVGQPVTFSATIKNQGGTETPNNVIHGVLFKVNGEPMTWSDSYSNSLVAGASRTQAATGGIYNGTFTWAPSTSGNFTVTAYVDDIDRIKNEANESNNTMDRVVSITGTSADTTAPTVTISNPVNGAIVAGTINVGATASDNVGVLRVELLINGAVKNTDTTASDGWIFPWNTTEYPNGQYSLVARAYDAANNAATSTAATITVNNTTAPPPPTITTGQLAGTVRSSNGQVLAGAKVSLTVNGSKRTVVTNSFGQYGFSNLPAGNYIVKYAAHYHVTQELALTVSAGNTTSRDVILTRR